MKASLITIANEKNIYDNFLVDLKKQEGIEYELLTIFNYNNEFSSARKVFNHFAKETTGDYLVFLHPDIRFLDAHALADIIARIDNLENVGVVGVAGAKRKGKFGREIVTSIVQGLDKQKVGRALHDDIEEVQTVDECLFVVPRNYFIQHPFSNVEGWHLYAVEYCLQAIKDGKFNYTVPANVWHLSDGKSMDPNYVKQINTLVELEHDNFEVICTTVKAWPTRGRLPWLYRKYYFFKQKIKVKIGES